MFDPCQKSVGTDYTTTIALLIVALIFVPAVLVVSHPLGYPFPSLALACSALCVTLAWVNWRRSSQLSIPSIATPDARAK
jgi:hypothetical protein